jgi:hypothetical protein
LTNDGIGKINNMLYSFMVRYEAAELVRIWFAGEDKCFETGYKCIGKDDRRRD